MMRRWCASKRRQEARRPPGLPWHLTNLGHPANLGCSNAKLLALECIAVLFPPRIGHGVPAHRGPPAPPPAGLPPLLPPPPVVLFDCPYPRPAPHTTASAPNRFRGRPSPHSAVPTWRKPGRMNTPRRPSSFLELLCMFAITLQTGLHVIVCHGTSATRGGWMPPPRLQPPPAAPAVGGWQRGQPSSASTFSGVPVVWRPPELRDPVAKTGHVLPERTQCVSHALLQLVLQLRAVQVQNKLAKANGKHQKERRLPH